MSVVGITFFNPESGYFKAHSVDNDRNRSVLDSRFNRSEILESGKGFVRLSGGCNVPIVSRNAHEHVSDSAADNESRMTAGGKNFDCSIDLLRNIYYHNIIPKTE